MRRTAAVVDVGSNTVRLLVARRTSRRLVATHTDGVRVGLGHDLEVQGRISEPKVTEAAEAVRSLCSQARDRGVSSLDVVVTAPGRQAANRGDFVAALEDAADQRVRVLSSEDEARLAFTGALTTSRHKDGLVAVVDLGGASTDIAIGSRGSGPTWVRSADLGALRLTTRMFRTLPPDPQDVDAARAAVSEAFAGLDPPPPAAAYVVGGSARALRRVVGRSLGARELHTAVVLLAGYAPPEIAARFRVNDQRASLLLAAALILEELQRQLGVPLKIAHGGIREGAALVALEARSPIILAG